MPELVAQKASCGNAIRGMVNPSGIGGMSADQHHPWPAMLIAQMGLISCIFRN